MVMSEGLQSHKGDFHQALPKQQAEVKMPKLCSVKDAL